MGDLLTAIMLVALIMVFVRPTKSGFKPISLIDAFSTAFQHSIADTYASVGLRGTDGTPKGKGIKEAPASSVLPNTHSVDNFLEMPSYHYTLSPPG